MFLLNQARLMKSEPAINSQYLHKKHIDWNSIEICAKLMREDLWALEFFSDKWTEYLLSVIWVWYLITFSLSMISDIKMTARAMFIKAELFAS